MEIILRFCAERRGRFRKIYKSDYLQKLEVLEFDILVGSSFHLGAVRIAGVDSVTRALRATKKDLVA